MLSTVLRGRSISCLRLFSTKPETPSALYDNLLGRKILREDPRQRRALGYLDDLHKSLIGYQPPKRSVPGEKKSFFGSLWKSKDQENPDEYGWEPKFDDALKGLYLYGSVGTGKTLIMDMLYETSPIVKKKRSHFHEFMLDVHRRIHIARQTTSGDFIPTIAAKLNQEATLLCLDEMQVTDITDAAILKRLFTHLLWRGSVLVTTSNRHPTELYKGGLQRELFVPFIHLLEKQCRVVDLNSQIDYRLTGTLGSQVYFTGAPAKDQLERLFQGLTKEAPVKPATIEISPTRHIPVARAAKGVAWFSFNDLCHTSYGAEEYIALAKAFPTVCICDIPYLTADLRDEARRFITLIDELYNHQVKLACSAAGEAGRIFQLGVQLAPGQRFVEPADESKAGHGTKEEEFMAARTVSRLAEMQTTEYLSRSRHLS